MKFIKLSLLLFPLSLVACSKPKEPEKPDPSLLTTPLCMTCTSDVNMGIINVAHASYIAGDNLSLQYSKDNKTWHDVQFNEMQKTFILKKNETIYFRGDNPEGFNSATLVEGEIEPVINSITMFASVGGYIDVGGNVMSLLKSTNFDKLTEIPCDFCFARLFTNYIGADYSLFNNASKLSLPATKLSKYCYYQMFDHNVILTDAPKLPATDLMTGCYAEMFNFCVGLERMEVAFDETAFAGESPYTTAWLSNAGINNATFVWPGDITGISRSASTIPSKWIPVAPEAY